MEYSLAIAPLVGVLMLGRDSGRVSSQSRLEDAVPIGVRVARKVV